MWVIMALDREFGDQPVGVASDAEVAEAQARLFERQYRESKCPGHKSCDVIEVPSYD